MLRLFVRRLSTRQLVYSEYGDPAKVIRLVESSLPDTVPAGHIRVRWMAAPLNPADINQIQGVYPVKPSLPAVGGNEGYAKVQSVGEGVGGFRPGDHVIPARSGLGTWREFADHQPNELYRINNELPVAVSATLQVNPSTAYRMLKDFVELKRGDVVVQNAGNSAVGRYVIQMCRILGFQCVSIVRNRPNIDELKKELTSLGSTSVFTEEEFASKENRGKVKARLALNAVGGRQTLFLANALVKNGVMVTYGGMSKQAISIPTASFIFTNIVLRGFWMSRWYEEEHTPEAREQMYADISKWTIGGELTTPPMDTIPLSQYNKALERAAEFDRKLLFATDK